MLPEKTINIDKKIKLMEILAALEKAKEVNQSIKKEASTKR